MRGKTWNLWLNLHMTGCCLFEVMLRYLMVMWCQNVPILQQNCCWGHFKNFLFYGWWLKQMVGLPPLSPVKAPHDGISVFLYFCIFVSGQPPFQNHLIPLYFCISVFLYFVFFAFVFLYMCFCPLSWIPQSTCQRSAMAVSKPFKASLSASFNHKMSAFVITQRSWMFMFRLNLDIAGWVSPWKICTGPSLAHRGNCLQFDPETDPDMRIKPPQYAFETSAD